MYGIQRALACGSDKFRCAVVSESKNRLTLTLTALENNAFCTDLVKSNICEKTNVDTTYSVRNFWSPAQSFVLSWSALLTNIYLLMSTTFVKHFYTLYSAIVTPRVQYDSSLPSGHVRVPSHSVLRGVHVMSLQRKPSSFSLFPSTFVVGVFLHKTQCDAFAEWPAGK